MMRTEGFRNRFAAATASRKDEAASPLAACFDLVPYERSELHECGAHHPLLVALVLLSVSSVPALLFVAYSKSSLLTACFILLLSLFEGMHGKDGPRDFPDQKRV
jgi:hypothetical protein